jgi:hypothetical protein
VSCLLSFQHVQNIIVRDDDDDDDDDDDNDDELSILEVD